MKILLIMDPGIPVPPKLYGGHERLVYMFGEEYRKLGHEVTILAGPDSHFSGTTVTFGVNNLKRSKMQRLRELLFAWKYLIQNRKHFDTIHNFGRLAYLLPVLNLSVKKVMTYGRPVATAGIKRVTSLPNKNLIFTACSNYCVSTGNVAGEWRTVYNTIDFSQYQLNETVEDDAPLMFLGRLDKIKGAHTAIKVAKETGHKLIIGGNIPHTGDNYAYFKTEIEPQIDNRQIIYLGALNDADKNKYLGSAKALLFPIEWDEPFGMVMIEAMACGTPVIAFNRGAVPEVVKENITGLIVRSGDNMTQKVARIKEINRRKCRMEAEAKFNLPHLAAQYLELFNTV